MSITISITDGPLGAAPDWAPNGAGAILSFEGIVREREGDGTIEALDYTAYEPMARTQLQRLGAELLDRHGLTALLMQHSRGRIAVGECSFRLLIAAPHRKEALAAMDEFIDRLKRDIPIWKSPVWRSAATT